MTPKMFPGFAIGLAVVVLIALGVEAWLIVNHGNFHANSIIRLVGMTVIVGAVLFFGMLLLVNQNQGKEIMALIAILGTIAGSLTNGT